MVDTLPGALARAAVAQGALVMLDLPYEPLEVPIEMVWHQRTERDDGCQWLLGELISSVKLAPSL